MSEANDRTMVVTQQLRDRHLSILVHHVVQMKDSDPWKAAAVICNLLLFQALTADERVHARTEGKLENMSMVLAEIGPPCCAVRDSVLERVFTVMRKGLTHASKVSQRKVFDPDFDMLQLKHTLRKSAHP